MENNVLDGLDPIHAKIAVWKSDGKLAGPVEIARGDSEEREFIILKAPAELLGDNQKRWQTGIDNWIATQSDWRYHPPTEKCTSGGNLYVRIEQPADHQRIDNNDVDWEGEVVSDKKTERVELFVNGSSQQILSQSPWKSTIHLSDGVYTFKFKAKIEGGEETESGEIKIGVKKNWDEIAPTPTSTIILTPVPTL